MMGEPIEPRGRHLGVAEDGGPFAERQVGGDDDRGALVEPADEVEQELSAGLGEGQVSEFVEDDEVEAGVGPALMFNSYAEMDEAVQARTSRSRLTLS